MAMRLSTSMSPGQGFQEGMQVGIGSVKLFHYVTNYSLSTILAL